MSPRSAGSPVTGPDVETRRQQPTVSVVIPMRDHPGTIPQLVTALRQQTRQPHELIVVDDASVHAVAPLLTPPPLVSPAGGGVTVIRFEEPRGPAAARNAGARQAAGDVLAFLDGDCRPDPDWIERIAERFADPREQMVMGRIVTKPSTFRGRCVAALGFPAGGSIGFERMWPVDGQGRTGHISTGNFAVRREVFWALDGFDETFAYSCEDAEFSERAVRAGVVMRFCPEIAVEHPELPSLARFVRNHFRRGQGNYWLKRRVGSVSHLVRMRLWSTKNILRQEVRRVRLPVTFGLLGLSFMLQQMGYAWELLRQSRTRHRRSASAAEVSRG